MKRGCISVSVTKCDVCHENIEHGECYVLTDDGKGGEKKMCAACAIKKKQARYITEKGHKLLSFLADSGGPPEEKEPAKKK
jgi:hypothetical protein